MSKQIRVKVRNEYRAQQNYTPSIPSSSNSVAVKCNSAALPKYGKATDSSVTDQLDASAGKNIRSVIAELEKRRAEFFALARSSEARAQDAEEKRELAESRLEQETKLRLEAERRLREFEDDRLRQLQAVDNERMKTTDAALAHDEAEARLKQAERRIKEAEKDVTTLTLAVAKAYQKKSEAEANARAAEEKAQMIQSLFLRAEASTHVATEGNLLFGLLIFASKSKLWAIEKAIRNVDERHRPQEDYLKNLLQKETAKLRSIPETATLAVGANRSVNLLKSVDGEYACRVTEQKGLGFKLKFTILGMVIMLLVGGCCELITGLLQN
jgi:chromosome segregation ATPase